MKTLLFLIPLCFTLHVSANDTNHKKLIELSKAYHDFMFRVEPPKGYTEKLLLNMPDELKATSKLIVQTITTNNDILNKEYLTLPDDKTLTYIHIISEMHSNYDAEDRVEEEHFIDSLLAEKTPRNILVDDYYSMLFTGYGNKDKFDMSKVNFTLDDYNLATETEKGIFFLQCASFCGSMIWGYMNIVKPPNTKEAYSYIKRFPKVNDLKYYQYRDLNFPDFQVRIDKEITSYKSYYIDKYYDLLLSHLISMDKQGAKTEDVRDLLLGSILKDKNLYKYTKNKETLESIFKVQKQD